jgi:galactose oxidase
MARSELDVTIVCDVVSDAAAMGYQVVSFSGGEPLMYGGLEAVLAHAKRHGLLTTITTNGFFIGRERLDRLRELVDILAVSLDGPSTIHNQIRGSAHAFDQSQRINFLDFTAGTGVLRVAAPDRPNICPPGHYMLFILSRDGVPSVAKIIQMQVAIAPVPLAVARAPERGAPLDIFARQAEVLAAAATTKGTPVVVGISGTCPYGIAACWGGAHEALYSLEGVDLVNPIPDADDSTAEVFLEDERLPALDKWDEQFHSLVNGRYVLRGVEVTLQGVIEAREGKLFLAGSRQRPPVQLAPLPATDKIQWNHTAQTLKPLEEGEALAYERLAAASRNLPDGQQVTVTGPLKQTDAGYQLHVRLFRNAEIV